MTNSPLQPQPGGLQTPPPGGRRRSEPVLTDAATGGLPVVAAPPATPLRPPLIVRRAVFIVVLILVAASVAVTLFVDFRLGGYVLAGALLLASAARALLPPEYCLGLLVRSRRFDATVTLVLALAIAVLARVVPVGQATADAATQAGCTTTHEVTTQEMYVAHLYDCDANSLYVFADTTARDNYRKIASAADCRKISSQERPRMPPRKH